MGELNVAATVCTSLAEDQAETVKRFLREYNQAANPELWAKYDDPHYDPVALVVVAHDDRANVVGGLFAETSMSWLKVSIMAVDQSLRRKGVGTLLINAAESEAARRGCKYSFLDTMSYQAPDFYRGCCYNEVGQIPDWDSHGHTKYFFTKQL